jgi:hypothetical protein
MPESKLKSQIIRHLPSRSLVLAVAALGTLGLCRPARAQTPVDPQGDALETAHQHPVPEAPLPQLAEARLAGQVADASGALIPGAKVLLRSPALPGVLTTFADEEGAFHFVSLPAGDYTVSATAPGFATASANATGLGPVERRDLPDIVLTVPAGHADAYVTLDRHELAATELHAAEHQRILGFPDFYTSFVWNAAPLDAGQKLSLGLHATTDRMAFVTAGLVASGEQIKGTFPGYGNGMTGFSKRYGAAYADGFVGKFIGGAMLPALFRQDPRYFYMGPSGTVKQRVWHAVSSAFVVRGDNGHMEPNYSHVLGNASAGALSTLYHPAADSAGKLALDNALLGTLGEAGVNVVRELFLKPFVRGGDADRNGMP